MRPASAPTSSTAKRCAVTGSHAAGILGVGEVVKPAKGTSSLELHAQAARRAMADAGIRPSDIDGLVVGYSLTEPKMVLSAAVAEYIGLSVD